MTKAKRQTKTAARFKGRKDKARLEFEVYEGVNWDKNIYWFILAFIIFSGVILLAISKGEFTLAIIVLLGAAVFYQQALVSHPRQKLILDGNGIEYKGKRWSWSNFRYFSSWKVGKNEYNIYLKKMSNISAPIVIHIKNQKTLPEIRYALRSILAEKLHHTPSGFELLNRILRY